MQSSSERSESSSASQSSTEITFDIDPENRGTLYPNMSNLLSAIELEEENANLRQEIEYLKRALNNKEDELYQL